MACNCEGLPASSEIDGLLIGTTAQMTALELQDLLSGAGVNIRSTGVWNSASVDALKVFALKRFGKDVPTWQINKDIVAYAKGKMVLVNAEILRKTMENVGLGGLDGLSADVKPESANTLIGVVLMAVAGGLGYYMGQSSVQDRRRPKRFGVARV